MTTLIELIPGVGHIEDSYDEIDLNIPSFGFYQSNLAITPYLRLPIESNIGTTTATVGCTTNMIIGVNDKLHWYISTSATKPSKPDLKNGVGAVSYGSTSDPSYGANIFNATGLTQLTTYYTYFIQSTDNGDSLILESGSWSTLDPASLFTSSPTLNSLSSPTETSIRVNFTAPNDDDHDRILFYFKDVEDEVVIQGGESSLAKNTTGTFDITGLTQGKSYDVFLIARDTSFKQSTPSRILTQTVGTIADENELLLTNFKNLLAKSATFQAITSSSTSSEAKTHIFKEWRDNPEVSFPYAIVSEEDSESEEIDTENFLTESTLSLMIMDSTETYYKTRNSESILSVFRENMGKIKMELTAIQGISGNFRFSKIGYISKPAIGVREDKIQKLMVNFYINTGF